MSVTLPEARERVYQRWVDNVPTALTDAWTFENEDFDEPAEDTSWARVSVRDLGGGQNTLGPIGGRKFRRTAAVAIQVFTPRGSGMGTGDSLAHTVRGIFEGVSFSGLDFNNGVVSEIPPDDDDKFVQHNVVVSFDYDETK